MLNNCEAKTLEVRYATVHGCNIMVDRPKISRTQDVRVGQRQISDLKAPFGNLTFRIREAPDILRCIAFRLPAEVSPSLGSSTSGMLSDKILPRQHRKVESSLQVFAFEGL